MLTLSAEMTYVERSPLGRGSDKFYIAILAGKTVYARYGRRNALGVGQQAVYRYATEDEACAQMWRLLRSKTSKGYHVVDAAVMDADPAATADTSGRQLFSLWNRLARSERASERHAVLRHPVRVGISPRTPKQGKQVMRALLDPHCPEDVLLECALAGPTERFLPSMAMSHPNCTDETRVAKFLNGSPALALA